MTGLFYRFSSKIIQCATISSKPLLRNYTSIHKHSLSITIQCKPLLFHESTKCRSFHLTQRKDAVPPIIILLLRPLAKLSAMLFGRFIRKRWQSLPPHERERILAKLRSKQTYVVFGITVFLGLVLFYVVEHIYEEPITKRKRFILCDDKQMEVIAQMEFKNQIEEHRRHVIPQSHPFYNRVALVANRILRANSHLPQIQSKKWGITVVDRPDITNAFVLPHGKIFLFTGMLNICTNDDQLAVVLSHEIAHAILSHVAENLSKLLLIDFLLLFPFFVFWAVFNDAGALFSQWLATELADIMVHLPFSRAIEKEADEVGLNLAARACFDVREAPVFWAKMSIVNKSPAPVEWLSTHPSNETRQFELATQLPSALKERVKSQCPLLPPPSYAQTIYSTIRTSKSA